MIFFNVLKQQPTKGKNRLIDIPVLVGEGRAHPHHRNVRGDPVQQPRHQELEMNAKPHPAQRVAHRRRQHVRQAQRRLWYVADDGEGDGVERILGEAFCVERFWRVQRRGDGVGMLCLQ